MRRGLLILVIAACSNAAPTPTPTPTPTPSRPPGVTDALVAVADRMVATLDKLATGLEAAKLDCQAGTAAIGALESERKAVYDEAQKFGDTDRDPAVKAWFAATYVGKINAAYDRTKGIATACAQDAAFMAALNGFALFPQQ
ncbi:MAG: hypothetical protein NT062_01725 [Proteobacteria bacterium]|nr:hypothetical protein [Pseudomonadota bacterium]